MKNNKAKKSDLIMEAALRIFAEKNFKEVPISEIAEEAGVAVGTVYEHFKNKEDLLFSLPLKSADIFDEQLQLHLEGLHSPIEKIRKYIWFYLYFSKHNPVFTELLLFELRNSKNFFNTRKQRGMLKSMAVILNLIEEGQAQGEIRNDVSPFMLRHMIIGTLEHVSTYWLLKERDTDITSYSNDVATMVLSGIVTRGGNNHVGGAREATGSN